jgi:hypothetical protein
MFHRIVMNIIHVGVEVVLIPDRVLPITPLPNRRTPRGSNVRKKSSLGGASRRKNTSGGGSRYRLESQEEKSN